MKLRLIADIECGEEFKPSPGHRENKIAFGSLEILRLPPPGEVVPGAKVGEPVSGRIVLQYLGPITLAVQESYEKKSQGTEKKAEGKAKTRSSKTSSGAKAKNSSKRNR